MGYFCQRPRPLQMIVLPTFTQSYEQPLISIVIKAEAPKEATPPTPIEYEIKSGDTLTSIATANNTTIERLWAKNTKLTNPDVIDVGVRLIIPFPDEKLTDRPIVQATAPSSVIAVRGSVAGNGYDYGYCTWYVKNRRPDLPNNLGNAITWVARAAAQGIPTGSVPRVGAVGQAGNHVVYVEAVYGDGTILISEMNFQGWNVQSSRVVSASSFSYIY